MHAELVEGRARRLFLPALLRSAVLHNSRLSDADADPNEHADTDGHTDSDKHSDRTPNANRYPDS